MLHNSALILACKLDFFLKALKKSALLSSVIEQLGRIALNCLIAAQINPALR